MSRLLAVICCALLWLAGTCHGVYAQEMLSFAEKIKAWEMVHADIEKTLKSEEDIEDERIKEYGQKLRQIRLDSANEAAVIKEQLNNQKELLAAIGDAPEGSSTEDKKIQEKRKKLDSDVTEIDTKFKQISLIIAKGDELALSLESYQTKRSKEKLLARVEPLMSMESLESFYEEVRSGLYNFQDWLLSGVLVIVGMSAFGLAAYYATPYINRFAGTSADIRLLNSFSCRRLFLAAICAYWVLILRFGIVSLEDYPVLESIIHIVASACLSVVLFLALGKFRFISSKTKRNDALQDSYSWLWNLVRNITRIILCMLPAVALAGYINLAQYVSLNIFITLLAALLFFVLRNSVEVLNARLQGPKEKEELSPLAITIVEPVFAIISVSLALFFWGMTSEDVATLIAKYRNGIMVGEVTVDFTGILSSIALFVVIYYLTKLIQWFLSSRVFPYTELDIGVKDAIVSITGYIGITTACLAAIGALGFDMSKLAIVAGALSVGIGFGLQAIFNNFVSGLILLFERPVRVGDWVIVGDKEGVVKKIQVRSTEIETFVNSSVIVPNSQLISETITNWTLHDKMGRVDIAVGVAYGSDTEKVKNVLLSVAAAHTEVRNIPEPKVYFMKFGDSSLDFELRCFIRNIRDMLSISSELRFAIDKAFRQHGIEIPFPQRDVHIKSSGNGG